MDYGKTTQLITYTVISPLYGNNMNITKDQFKSHLMSDALSKAHQALNAFDKILEDVSWHASWEVSDDAKLITVTATNTHSLPGSTEWVINWMRYNPDFLIELVDYDYEIEMIDKNRDNIIFTIGFNQ